jgi:ABC-type glycerol-3-phosphate transport system substrate-binding protein
MQTAGAWHPAWARSSGCADCRYLPLPVPDEGGVAANVVVGNAIYAALSSTEHPEEAMMFLEYLASDDVQTNVFWSTGRLPATISSLQQILDVAGGDTVTVPEYYTSEDPVADAAPFVTYISELTSENVRTLPAWAEKGAELNALWNSMFAEVLTSEEPVEDILNRYQTEAEALVAAD